MDVFSEDQKINLDNLGITQDFLTFLNTKVGLDRKLNATHLLEDFNSGSLTVNLEFKPVQNIGKNGGKTTKDSRHFVKEENCSHQKRKKKKSPSRLKRDKERLRKFIESKRQQRTLNARQLSRNTSNSSLPTFQCSPPRDETVSVADPAVVTIDSLDLTSQRNVSGQFPTDLPVSAPTEPVCAPSNAPDPSKQDNPKPDITAMPCTCLTCTKVSSGSDPSSELYSECTFCLKPACELQTELRACTKCLMQAYCSKECQKKDWKVHKTFCDTESAPKIREFREVWARAVEIAKVHALHPETRPAASHHS